MSTTNRFTSTKISLRSFAILFAMLLSLHFVAAQTTRYADNTGPWNDPDTWQNGIPNSNDPVEINDGVEVTVTANAACASIVFLAGTNTTGITVENTITLSITNSITMNNADNSPVTRFITGDGTVNAGSLVIGSNTQPNNTNATRIHRLDLSAGIFNVNNISIISRRRNNNSRIANGYLNIESGTVNVSGAISTTNGTSANVSTVALGAGAPTLNFTNALTPIVPDGTGESTFTFNTSGATVQYTRSGNQNIYGTNYHHLNLLNGSTKTFNVNTATIGGNLLFNGVTSTLLRSLTIGGNVTFEGAYNVTLGAFTHNVGGNWTKNEWGSYNIAGSTINFTGASSEINGSHWMRNFNNLTVSKTAGQNLNVLTNSHNAELVVEGNFTLASGNYNQGTTNSVFSGNWINIGGSLVSSPGVIRMNGSGRTIGGTASTTFNNLTINNNAGGISLGNNITVNSSLLLNNGLLRLGNFNLTLGANATNYTDNYWDANMIITNGTGEIRKLMTANGSYKFHVGDDTSGLDYSPATITFNSGTYAPGAYVSLRVEDAKHPNNSSPTHFLSRYWIIGQSGISNFNYNFVGNYNYGGDVNGNNTASQFAGIYNNSTWTNIGNVGNVDGQVNASNVTTVGDITGISQLAAPYCNASGNTTYETGIRLVNFNTINNATLQDKTVGYSDFTNISTTVTKGNAYNLTVNLNTDGPYTIYTRAWIDWNGNGSFNDAGEMYDLGTTYNNDNGATSLSPLSIAVPESAVPGTTRMRVIARFAGYATACETNFDGEVGDYSIVVQERSIATGTIVGSPFTSGAAVNVPFTVTGAFLLGNVFTAQLSDATGSFASPTNIGTLPATTAGTIAATIPTNTPSGTAYRIRVISSNPSVIGTDNGVNLTINQIVVNPVVVEATVGTHTAIYNNLKLAFDKINDGTHRGVIDVKIFENITETTSAVLNASGGSANYSSVAIYPAVAGVTVSGNLNSAMIQLNGADNVTIDGRVNQAGSRNLTIINSNTGTSARTIELINSAQNNTINYVNIKGAGTSATQGTINISTSAAGTGNTNNSIAFNNISGVNATTRAANSIYSAGTATRENSDITIRDNDFQDFLRLSQASNGILIAGNSTEFTVNNNRFFETASMAPTASVEYAAIRVNNTLANNIVITNNTIGGNGSTGDWVKTIAFDNTFNAIVLNAGSTNNSVQGNVVRNFDYRNNANASWYGIRILGGSAIVSANTIGNTTAAASIKLNNATSSGTLFGVAIESAANNTVSNNNIAGLQTNAASTVAVNITGIFKNATAGELTLSNNIIGSTTVANSIHTASEATGAAQLLYGIHNLGTGTININNNTIANLNNATTSGTTASRMRGIISEAGLNTISFNRINNLNTGGLSNGANYPAAAIVGISLINKTAGLAHTIADNTINNLSTTNTGKIEMYGIFYDGPDASEALIARNFVHTFIVPNTGGSTDSYLHGISLLDGSYTAVNNIVYLGSNITIGCSIWGIWTFTNDNAKVYHNTVYLAGIALSGSSNSYAFRSLNCPASLDLRNNILWTGRTNDDGDISHYALHLSCTSNATVNFNNYQFAQEFGSVGGTSYASLSAWRTGTNLDANSLNINPQLVNLGGTLPVDYQTNIQLQGTAIAAVTTDFDGITRVTPTMGAWEFFDNPVEIWNGLTFRQSYPTLKAAFDAINAGTYTGDMIIKFKGNTIETASAVLNASGTGTGPSSYSRILIYPARTGVTVTGNLAAPLVSLNGARHVTFDGRVNGISDPYQFTFINNNTSATAETSTFRFVNSAQNDTIRYVNIQGASTATAGGNVYFAGATAGTGNSNNVITQNRITGLTAANRPVNAIYSQGTGIVNSGNIIHNNEIFDIFNPAISSQAIHVGANSTAFTITNNSIYETANLSPTSAASYYGVRINNTSGNAFVVSNNHIGGSAALSAGNFVKTASNNNPFFAIDINVGTTASSVQGNIIRNITYSNNTNANFNAISIGAGVVNVGTSSGNIIGAAVGNGSIAFSNTTNGGSFFGIAVSSTAAVNVQNNTIASINVGNTAANATNFAGIYKTATAGNFTASRNTIGSLSTANSIQTTSASTANAQTLYGIYSEGTDAIVVEENQIQNLTNATTNTNVDTRGRVNGIWVSNGSSNAINSNTVSNLSIANLSTANDFEASAIGINLSGAVPSRTVNDNRISFISNTNPSYDSFVFGLYFRSATTGTNTANRNFIHNITTTSTNASLIGIVKSTSAATFANNIISLGANATGHVLYGFYDVGGTGNTTNLYFNTIYISGTSSANSSMALRLASADNTRDLRNNIFHNARSRTGSSGSHYAILYNFANNSNLTTNYNNYLATGTNGVLAEYATATRTTLAELRTSTGDDVNSISTPPQYANATPTTDPAHYKPTVTLMGIAGTGVVTDFGLFSRPASAPTMGAWELIVNKWKGSSTDDWNTAGNWTGNTVPPVDATIVFDDVPLRHCTMDQNRFVNNIVNAQGTYRVVTNGFRLRIKGELQFSNGAQIDASTANSTIEFAGATQQQIPGGAFFNNNVYNLDVNNPNNVVLNGTLRLLNNIVATQGRFDGSSNPTNFVYAGTALQTINDNIFFNSRLHNLIIDNAVGVEHNTDLTLNNNLTINAARRLTILPNKLLYVSGSISNNAGVNGLTIKASTTQPNGSLIFFNAQSNPVPATVEMYSKASWDLTQTNVNNRYNWQFFGIPVRNLTAVAAFTGAYVRRKIESGTLVDNHWVQLENNSAMSPFLGYELVQAAPKTYTIQGELVNQSFNSGQLVITSGARYPGQHLFANPYAAAIDARQIEFGSSMQNTVWLYNTGTFAAWDASGNGKKGEDPGQYTAIPQNAAGFGGIPVQIPSMGAILVRAKTADANAFVNFPYAAVSMKNTDRQRAKATGEVAERSLEKENITMSIIRLEGKNSNDKLWIFTGDKFSKDFDNGYDGHKMSGGVLNAQLFVIEKGVHYQINSTPELHNQSIGFRNGQDESYTLRFEHENIEAKYSKIYLHDLLTNAIVDVTENKSAYEFTAINQSNSVERFRILTRKSNDNAEQKFSVFNGSNHIYVESTSASNAQIMVYDVAGRLFARQSMSGTLHSIPVPRHGTYVVKVIEGIDTHTQKIIIN